jgi:hypothetical protein
LRKGKYEIYKQEEHESSWEETRSAKKFKRMQTVWQYIRWERNNAACREDSPYGLWLLLQNISKFYYDYH